MWQCIECESENPKTLSSCTECSAPRPSSSLIGEQISQWVIESELGEGGMAVVFEARHKMLGSPVAIKILRADMMNKREVVGRFRTEALAASHLRHDNVIQVHDFGTQEGIGVYMVLEYLDGMDLEAKLEEAPLPIPWVMNVTKQICSGLEAAHTAGIIHRDLKPSNIYLVPRKDHDIPLVKILDFGIAKIQESQLFAEGEQNLTRTGTVLGTPYYLSPEQLRRRDKQPLSSSVDIYALGVILFQLLTGQLPIEEPTLAEQLAGILTKKPPLIGTLRPELKGTSLELLINQLLAKKPEDRPATIAEVWSELEKAAGALNDPAIDAALRQQWNHTYKTPDVDTSIVSNAQRSPLKQYGMTFLLAVMLLVGGSVLAYILLKKPTTIAKKRKPPPRRRMTLPKWMDLNNQGVLAYKSGDNLRAFKLWQESLKELNTHAKTNKKDKQKLIKKSQEILRYLAIVSQKSGRFYNALRFAQQLAKSKALPEKEKKLLQERIRFYQRTLDNVKENLDAFAKALTNGIKRKRYQIAHQAYRGMMRTRDKSLPAPYLKAAAPLEKLLPALSLALYNKAYKLEMNAKAKEKIDSLRSSAANKVSSGREAMILLLQSGKKSKRIKRSFEKIILGQPHDKKLHSIITTRIGKLLTTNPRLAQWHYNNYVKAIKKLQKTPAWLWIAKTKKQIITPVQTLKKTGTILRKARKTFRIIARLKQKEERQAKYGRIEKALNTKAKRLSSQMQVWKQFAASDSIFSKEANTIVRSLETREQNNQNALALWKKIKEQHTLDQIDKTNQDFQKLLELTKGQQIAEAFKKQYNKWKKRHTKATNYLLQGEQSAKRRRWTSCKYQFARYLRLYPKSSKKEVVKLKRCKCRCKLPAPFEPCSEQCKLPY